MTVCLRCYVHEVVPGKSRCEKCLDYDLLYNQRRRERRAKITREDFDIDVVAPPAPSQAPDYSRLVRAAARPHASVESVCNELGMSPAMLEAHVKTAQGAGFAVRLEGKAVGVSAAAPSSRTVDVAPIVGERQTIAVISDTHFGSRYCMVSALQDFIKIAYNRGVREVLHCGDMLDGCYEHGKFELTEHGIDDQADAAVEGLPQLPGLRYCAITGNHDHTFTALAGLDVGRYIEQRFRAAGREDVTFYGNRSAMLRVRGAVCHLWHPQGGAPYALSYRIQKVVESYAPGNKPDFSFTGHLHKSCACVVRGVHGYLVPCWQSGESAFGRSLVGAPAIGGLVLGWEVTPHGTLRSVSTEVVSYYQDERARDV